MSLSRDADGSCTTECVSGDCPAEVKQENCTVVKQEPDDVCCVISLLLQDKILQNSLGGLKQFSYYIRFSLRFRLCLLC